MIKPRPLDYPCPVCQLPLWREADLDPMVSRWEHKTDTICAQSNFALLDSDEPLLFDSKSAASADWFVRKSYSNINPDILILQQWRPLRHNILMFAPVGEIFPLAKVKVPEWAFAPTWLHIAGWSREYRSLNEFMARPDSGLVTRCLTIEDSNVFLIADSSVVEVLAERTYVSREEIQNEKTLLGKPLLAS